MKRLPALLLALMLLCCASARADSPVLSERCRAIQLAQDEMLSKYGITEGMNELFIRTCETRPMGEYIVSWYPSDTEDGIAWLQGVYTASVTVKDGTFRVDLIWSHDGESTEGGFDAEAWGAQQLQEIMDEYRETFETAGILQHSDEVALALNYPEGGYDLPEAAMNTFSNETVPVTVSAAPAEFESLARSALKQRYPDADWARVEPFLEAEEPDVAYGMLDGIPVAMVSISFWGWGDENWEWQDGDGYYTVYVNLTNLEIEEILYTSGLFGNG